MNNFGGFLTPEEALKLVVDHGDTTTTLDELRARAKRLGKCEVCESEDIWKYGGSGMCFSCTTGEADASDDYELIDMSEANEE